MASKKGKAVETVEEVDDEVETLDEVDDTEDSAEPASDGLSAKQLATALGTEGRTVRKFLRSKFGKVGQGQRWNIRPGDVEALKKEFSEWGKSTRSEGKKTKAKSAPAPDDEVDDIAELGNDELEEIDDIEDLDDLELE